MKFLLILFSFSRLLAAELFDEKAIHCKVVSDQIQKMDQIIPEKEAKGLDVSEWYTKRNQYLSENKDCAQLKNVTPLESKNKTKINSGSKSNIATCTPIDLRKKLGAPRNQGKTGWCFAYAASDLLTAKIGKEISAVSVAINFKTDSIFSFFDKLKGNSAFRTGVIGSAIRTSQKDLCLEGELPSNLSGIDLEKVFIDITQNKISNGDCLSLKGVLPAKEVANFVKIAKKLSDRDFLKEMAKSSCKSKIQHNYEAEEIKKSGLIEGIGNVLNSGQVVGIGFDPRFWEEGTQYIGKKFDHAASVVGRKWDAKSNTCRYMIRDSQGSNCSIYDKVYECEKGGSYTWVPETTLINNIDSAYYLK